MIKIWRGFVRAEIVCTFTTPWQLKQPRSTPWLLKQYIAKAAKAAKATKAAKAAKAAKQYIAKAAEAAVFSLIQIKILKRFYLHDQFM